MFAKTHPSPTVHFVKWVIFLYQTVHVSYMIRNCVFVANIEIKAFYKPAVNFSGFALYIGKIAEDEIKASERKMYGNYIVIPAPNGILGSHQRLNVELKLQIMASKTSAKLCCGVSPQQMFALIKSGDLAGHILGPFLLIHLFEKILFR